MIVEIAISYRVVWSRVQVRAILDCRRDPAHMRKRLATRWSSFPSQRGRGSPPNSGVAMTFPVPGASRPSNTPKMRSALPCCLTSVIRGVPGVRK